jgi:Flp pilus assembly CpaE family ATPase
VESNGQRFGGRAAIEVRPAAASPAGPGAAPPSGRRRTRVVLGIHDLALHQEVLDFLERDPRIDVAAAVADGAGFIRSVADLPADIGVSCPVITREVRILGVGPEHPRTVVVAEEMTVPVLRDAIELGADGVYSWPEERDDLADALARPLSTGSQELVGRGRVFAVFGARGGAGATFVSTHLAAEFARAGLRTVLVDLDQAFSDLTPALGLASGDHPHTILDLLPVVDEISPEHLQDVVYRHPAGFSVLLSGHEGSIPNGDEMGGRLFSAAVALLAVTHQAVVLHLPRAFDEVARTGIALADEVVLVCTLELLSLHGARRAVAALGLDVRAGGFRVVINRAHRSALSPADVERIVGVRPSIAIHTDRAVRRAQQQGKLLGARSRARRDIRRLATVLRSEAEHPARSARRS